MRVLVTGAAGFIGSQLAETLAAAGDDVVGIDAMTDYYDVGVKRAHVASLTEAGVRFVEADLRYSDLAPFVEGVQVVHHQAAQPGVRNSWAERFTDYDGHNILGTQRLLEAARHAGVHRFVYASSSSVYGNAATYPTIEETVPAPFSPSGVTKLAAEHLCRAYALNFGLATVALRYFTVYGPRQRPDMSIHRLIEAALDGTTFPRFGDGTQVRELTHVTDAIVAARLGASAEVKPGAVFNISGGSPIVLRRPDRARRGRGGGSDRRRGTPGRARGRAAQRRLDRAGPRAARVAPVDQPAGRDPQPGGLAPRPSSLTRPQRRSSRSLIHSRVERSSLMLFSCRRTRSDRLSTPCRTVAMSAALRSAPRLAASSSALTSTVGGTSRSRPICEWRLSRRDSTRRRLSSIWALRSLGGGGAASPRSTSSWSRETITTLRSSSSTNAEVASRCSSRLMRVTTSSKAISS